MRNGTTRERKRAPHVAQHPQQHQRVLFLPPRCEQKPQAPEVPRYMTHYRYGCRYVRKRRYALPMQHASAHRAAAAAAARGEERRACGQHRAPRGIGRREQRLCHVVRLGVGKGKVRRAASVERG
jgi:hypothetical protein